MNINMHSLHSTLRERIVEHVFVSEALRTIWRRGITDVEVLRSEVDAHGYDLVMGREAIVARAGRLEADVAAVPGREILAPPGKEAPCPGCYADICHRVRGVGSGRGRKSTLPYKLVRSAVYAGRPS